MDRMQAPGCRSTAIDHPGRSHRQPLDQTRSNLLRATGTGCHRDPLCPRIDRHGFARPGRWRRDAKPRAKPTACAGKSHACRAAPIWSERAGKGRTAARGIGRGDPSPARRYLSDRDGAAAAQIDYERPVGRRRPTDRRRRRRQRIPQSGIRRTRYPDRSAPPGDLHHHRGGRTVVSIAALPTGPRGRLLALSLVLVSAGRPLFSGRGASCRPLSRTRSAP